MQGITTTSMSSFSRSHRRKISGELDVFEATWYFSGDVSAYETPASSRRAMRADRMSLDIPMQSKLPPRVETSNHIIKDKIKCHKQPSSPGSKLASFLNSLFQQYSKKKAKSSVKGDYNHHHHHHHHHHSDHQEERRKWRSSISSITPTTTNYEYSKSGYYSSSSCNTNSSFMTPSLHSKKREQGFKDHDHEVRVKMRLGDELNLMNMKHKEKEVDDDDGKSDSSSDLFELKINLYEFGDDQHGLPVYGSTDMGVVTRGDGLVC